MKAIAVTSNPGLVLESSPVTQQQVPPQQVPPPPVEIAQNSQESNGDEPMVKASRIFEDEGVATAKILDKNHDHEDHVGTTDDSSTPALYGSEKGLKMKKMMKTERKKRRREEKAVVRSKQVRMDTMKELERMRVEVEAKRGEMDLKRTEIIANTRFEIARLFASTATKNVDSSLRIGRT
ncbi:Protein sds23 [Bienertia sinuspersici]